MISLTSTNTTKPECPICEGRGLRIVFKDGEPFGERCSCMEQKKMDNILKNSKITPQFQKLTFKNFTVKNKPFNVKQARQAAINYVKSFDEIKGERCNSIAFLGQPGVGKTHLCCAIANNLMAKGVPVLYFPHREGFSELKHALNKSGSKSYWEVSKESDCYQKIQVMKEVAVLVWDDLLKGREEPTEYEKDVMFEVLNYRYLNHLPIIVSSEKLSKWLLEFDEGIGSRITHPAKGRITEFEPDPSLNHRLL